MNTSGMGAYATENNSVNVCGPPASPDPEYTSHILHIVTVCGQPASPDPEDFNYGMLISPSPEMINYQPVTGYGPSPSSPYTIVTYERNRITQYSPHFPEESEGESSSNSSDSPGSELISTPVKQFAPTYMLEPYFATPTTSKKRIRRRQLNFRDPNVMYDLEDISEDESDSGEPLAQKQMTDDVVMDNESMREWISAISNIYKSMNSI